MALLDPVGGAGNIKHVVDGEADACLTSVAHYLTARAELGPVPARFAAVVYQRNPMAAIVRQDSPLRRLEDLPGRLVGGPSGGRFLAEYRAALVRRGLDPPAVAELSYGEGPAALGRGEVEALADFADLVPRIGRQAGVPVRAIPLGLETYANGLVVSDRVPSAVVRTLVTGVTAVLVRQQSHPRAGLASFLGRYPEHDAEAVLESWRLAQASIFTGPEPGHMDRDKWRRTIEYQAATHGFSPADPGAVCRLELAA